MNFDDKPLEQLLEAHWKGAQKEFMIVRQTWLYEYDLSSSPMTQFSNSSSDRTLRLVRRVTAHQARHVLSSVGLIVVLQLSVHVWRGK